LGKIGHQGKLTEIDREKIIETYIAAYMDNLPSYVSRSDQSVHLAIPKANARAVAAVLASVEHETMCRIRWRHSRRCTCKRKAKKVAQSQTLAKGS
jgi:hypothetical protein